MNFLSIYSEFLDLTYQDGSLYAVEKRRCKVDILLNRREFENLKKESSIVFYWVTSKQSERFFQFFNILTISALYEKNNPFPDKNNYIFFLIPASGSKDNQQPVKLWEPKTGTVLTTLHAHKSTVMDIKVGKSLNQFFFAFNFSKNDTKIDYILQKPRKWVK